MNRVPRMVHDKDAKLDYGWDWTLWLAAGETISNYTVTGPTGFTIDPPQQQGDTIVAYVQTSVSGLLTCHVTTNNGRQDDRSVFLLVQER